MTKIEDERPIVDRDADGNPIPTNVFGGKLRDYQEQMRRAVEAMKDTDFISVFGASMISPAVMREVNEHAKRIHEASMNANIVSIDPADIKSITIDIKNNVSPRMAVTTGPFGLAPPRVVTVTHSEELAEQNPGAVLFDTVDFTEAELRVLDSMSILPDWVDADGRQFDLKSYGKSHVSEYHRLYEQYHKTRALYVLRDDDTSDMKLYERERAHVKELRERPTKRRKKGKRK